MQGVIVHNYVGVAIMSVVTGGDGHVGRDTSHCDSVTRSAQRETDSHCSLEAKKM